ncbi:MAG: right-handed parallel beta-helix repeat-containing protein [Clostridia bacterium]|nr:right-handed parallel beta-helix repeat-containing protein [Clostridia bacterium]
MKKLLSIALSFILVLAVQTEYVSATGISGEAFEIHVSKNGSDDADGSEGAPVRTINRALKMYGAAKKEGSILVHSGVYEEAIVLDSNFSGLTLRAVGDVTITPKTIHIPSSSFRRVTDQEALEVLPDVARGEVRWASLTGCTDPSLHYKVFEGETEQPIARFPNGVGFEIADGSVGKKGTENFETVYFSNKEKLAAWAKDSNASAVLFRSSGYFVAHSKIVRAFPETGEMHLVMESGNDIQVPGKRFFVYDTLSEVDCPGEWYIDRKAERIYYYPQGDFDTLSVSADETVPIRIDSAKNITIDGFEIRGALKNGINLNSSENIRVTGCRVRNVGAAGISATNMKNSSIENCIVSQTGKGGIRLNYKDYLGGTGGSDPDLTPQGNIVENCIVHHTGVFDPVSSGVYFGGTGNIFRHNTVHDIPHIGIWFLGNDNLIEYNDFYNVLKYGDDLGVIYGNPEMKGFGNKIQYNRIRNFESLNPYNGEIYMIYLDADTSGTTVYGNIIDLSNFTGYATMGMIGGGRNNVVEKNVCIGGAASQKTNLYMSNRYNKLTGGTLHSNLVKNLSFYNFIRKLTDEQKEKWFKTYPKLEEEYGYYAEYVNSTEEVKDSSEIGVARDCYVKDNIFVNEYMFSEENTKTYLENLSSVCGPPNDESKGGLRYDIDKSTGNRFLAEYDTSGEEAMKAGAKNTLAAQKAFDILYPQNGANVKYGSVRLVWQADGSQLRYDVSVRDALTGDMVYEATTTETFAETILPTGKYNMKVVAQYQDSAAVDIREAEFECVGDGYEMFSTLDLSANDLLYKTGDSGKLCVAAFDYDNIRHDITGSTALSYKTSDHTVAEVTADGRYTIKGEGAAVITAEYNGIEASMVVYSTDGDIYNELNTENYESYHDSDSNSETVYGQITLIDDPTGNGKALTESVKPKFFENSRNYSTYAMGIWVYDSLSNAPRFGVTSRPHKYNNVSHQVYYGLENSTDTMYHLRHHHNDPVEPYVNLEIPRRQGWHQIFMTVEYDTENEKSYVQIYFDGKMVVEMINNSRIDPRVIEQSTAAPIKQRFIAQYTPSEFAFTSTSVDDNAVALPDGQINLLFNKQLDAAASTVSEVYFTAPDGSRTEATVSITDNYCIVTPQNTLSAGETYTLIFNGSFVNSATPLTPATTLNLNLDKSFKVRDNIKTMNIVGSYKTADGKTTLEVSAQSLLKEGKQSALLIMAVKDKGGAMRDISTSILVLNPLEVLKRQISGEEDMIVEAYIWDKMDLLLPLREKITNEK